MTTVRSMFLLLALGAIVGLCGSSVGSLFPTSASGETHGRVFRIGAGRLNAAEWVSTLSPKKGGGPLNVCVSIALAVQASDVEISEGIECDRVRDDSIFLQSINAQSRNGERSVFAAIFSPAVKKVVVDLNRGNERAVRIKHLSASRARQLGLEQVGYWVHAYAGPACLQEITTYDHLGNILNQSKFGC